MRANPGTGERDTSLKLSSPPLMHVNAQLRSKIHRPTVAACRGGGGPEIGTRRIKLDMSEPLPGHAPLSTPGNVVKLEAVAPVRASKSRFARIWPVTGLILVLVTIAAFGAWWALAAKSSIVYGTAPVTRGAISRTVTATGTVNPELTIIVGTYVSGVIQEVSCDYNTEVKKGQLCARIDPRPYQTVVDQARANLMVARAQLVKDKASLTYAQRAFERALKLLPTSAISQDGFDIAKNTYDQAVAQITFDEATIQQRQAVLDAAQVNLDYTKITSPVDGTVVSRNVTVGQTVAASFQTPTLFLIATDLTKMQVDANVSESDIGAIEIGDTATFTVDAFSKRTFRGTVSQVRQSPQMVQNVVTYDVVVVVDNTDLALKPGMTAATRLVVDQRNDVLRIPNQALRYAPGGIAGARDNDQTRVWVLRDGEPVAVAVTPGLQDDSFSEIDDGQLKPGDRVITGERAASNRKNVPRLRL
jgi:HlyD family secretion protein